MKNAQKGMLTFEIDIMWCYNLYKITTCFVYIYEIVVTYFRFNFMSNHNTYPFFISLNHFLIGKTEIFL